MEACMNAYTRMRVHTYTSAHARTPLQQKYNKSSMLVIPNITVSDH